MAKKILHIVETGYRATLEEQDDPVLWLAQSLRNNGADGHVLLRGSAVSYAVKGQDASGLAFGERRQTQPPRLADDLARLHGSGAALYVVDEELKERGIRADELIDGVERVSRESLPRLLEEHEQVWQW